VWNSLAAPRLPRLSQIDRPEINYAIDDLPGKALAARSEKPLQTDLDLPETWRREYDRTTTGCTIESKYSANLAV
jgi:hypothetical protein